MLCLLDNYVKDMCVHLHKYCTEIDNAHLIEVFTKCNELLEENNYLMTEEGSSYLEKLINSRYIPSLQLLLKDHNDRGPNGRYPTRLLVSSKNFTQRFSKLAYKSIQNLFDRTGVAYGKHTIQNSFHIKSKLKELGFCMDNVAIISLDIKDVYPWCKFKAAKAAVKHCASTIDDHKRASIFKCLDILGFSICNMLVSFQDKYYEYVGDANPDNRGLTIGAAGISGYPLKGPNFYMGIFWR